MEFKDIVTKNQDLLVDLYFRWQDEKDYEDINDYGEAFAKNAEVQVLKSTKRPFGFHIGHGSKVIHLMVKTEGNNLGLSWKEVK